MAGVKAKDRLDGPNGDAVGTAIVPAMQSVGWSAVHNLQEAIQVADMVGKSNALPDVRNSATALLKIMAGGEMGFGPFASLVDVHIIEGKPSIGAHLRASSIKRSGRYDYRIHRCDREACDLEFFEFRSGKWESLGHVAMTYQEADDAGLTRGREGVKRNWKVSPDDMLFARCISKGYRRHCPDLTGGVLAYDPDELDNHEPATPQQRLSVAPPAQLGEVVDAEFQVTGGQPQPPDHGGGAAPMMITTEQMNSLEELFKSMKFTPEQIGKAMAARGVSSVQGLTSAQASEIIESLRERVRAKWLAGSSSPT